MLNKRCVLALFLVFTALLTSSCNGLSAVIGLFTPENTQAVNIDYTPSPEPTASATPEAVKSPETTQTPEASASVPPSAGTAEPTVDPDATPLPYGPEDKLVAITFDDGPYSSVTGRILDTIEAYAADGIHVTFFVVGLQILKYPGLVTRAANLGCEIGNHTYHHKNLTKLSPEEMLAEVEDVSEMIRELTDASPTLVRPPYGARDEVVYATLQYPLILWDIDTLDWSTHDADSTVEAALRCEDGDIILMHDVRADTADAFERIVPELLARGFKLVTVSEMFAAKGISLEPGKSYRHAK